MTRRARNTALVVGALTVMAVGLALYFSGALRAAPDLEPIPEIRVTTTDRAVREQLVEARQVVEDDPHDAAANGRLGMLYELYLYPEAMRVCYQRASQLAPRQFRWKYHLGRTERMLGDADAAIVTLRSALEIDQEYVPAIAELGEAYLEGGRSTEAETTFRSALRRNPQSCAALLGLGRVMAKRGEHDAAIGQYQPALRIAPSHAPLHYALGLSYRALGETDKAQLHLEKARNGKPANPDADPLRAEIGDLEVGIDADFRRAAQLLNSGQYDRGITLLRKVVAADPDHHGAFASLGRALLLVNQPVEALTAYESAIALDPANVACLRASSMLLYRAQRFQTAVERLQMVFDSGLSNADDHHLYGAIQMQLRRPAEAIRHFEIALEQKPDHVDARRGLLAMLKFQVDQAATDAEAVSILQRIVQLEPRDTQALSVLGARLERMGDLAAALDAFERVLAVNPNLPDVVRKRDELRTKLDPD